MFQQSMRYLGVYGDWKHAPCYIQQVARTTKNLKQYCLRRLFLQCIKTTVNKAIKASLRPFPSERNQWFKTETPEFLQKELNFSPSVRGRYFWCIIRNEVGVHPTAQTAHWTIQIDNGKGNAMHEQTATARCATTHSNLACHCVGKGGGWRTEYN